MQYGGAATPSNTCAVVNMKDKFLIILSASARSWIFTAYAHEHNRFSSVDSNIGNLNFLETHNFHLLEKQT